MTRPDAITDATVAMINPPDTANCTAATTNDLTALLGRIRRLATAVAHLFPQLERVPSPRDVHPLAVVQVGGHSSNSRSLRRGRGVGTISRIASTTRCGEGLWALLIWLTTGSSWVDIEAILDHQVLDTTLRARHDEWTAAGVFEQLRSEALAVFDHIVGLVKTVAGERYEYTTVQPCGCARPADRQPMPAPSLLEEF